MMKTKRSNDDELSCFVDSDEIFSSQCRRELKHLYVDFTINFVISTALLSIYVPIDIRQLSSSIVNHNESYWILLKSSQFSLDRD